MNDGQSPFDDLDENELSEEDLAVLRAFEAMESWPPAPSESEDSASVPQGMSPQRVTTPLAQDNEMLLIFLEEADEDMTMMRQALHQLEEGGPGNLARFVPLQRAGHKLRGTAGAIDFSLTSLIAGQIEDIAERVAHRTLSPRTALQALSSAVTALEHCLQQITTTGLEGQETENELLLEALAATYQDLGIDLNAPEPPPLVVSSPSVPPTTPSVPALQDSFSDVSLLDDDAEETLDTLEEELTGTPVHISAHITQEHSLTIPTIRVDMRRLETLTSHTEYLIEQRSVLENARHQVDIALQEFQSAQTRLQQLEPLLPLFLTNGSSERSSSTEVTATSSSLISRILNENPLRRTSRSTKTRPAHNHHLSSNTQPGQWDEMNMERYSEKDKLLSSLREAIVDIHITGTRLQAAQTHFSMLQQEYLARISLLRRDTLSMRQSPFSTITPRLARVVKMSALGQPVQFEVIGEHIEIDQDILEQLAPSLMQLLRTCIADAFISEEHAHEAEQESPRIWLHIRERGSEITLEMGFSMTIQGGVIEATRHALEPLNGRLTLWRNNAGGVSFVLSIPRSQGATHCLQIRTSNQSFIVPFVQVLRVVDQRQGGQDLPEQIYDLNDLLGFRASDVPFLELEAHPLLLITLDHPERTVGVAVDQVLDEVELIVKPLKPYLQRPGIPGAAVDGQGAVVLMVDLPILIERYIHGKVSQRNNLDQFSPGNAHQTEPDQVHILVADDAVYLRHSVRQTLQHYGYHVTEARDGMETLERLQEAPPAICLLDIEMPNLNGYDVLSMIRNTPAYAHVKVIMLTSRSSEKHRKQAMDLGADAYLTKPCSPEALIKKVKELTDERYSSQSVKQ